MRWLRDYPKAELHVHLEGSLRPATLRLLNPSLTEHEITSRLTYSDFPGFLRSFIWADSHLRGPGDYAIAMTALAHELEEQGVVYAEVILSVGVWLWKQLNADEVFAAIRDAAAQSPVKIRFIMDAIRQLGVEPATRVADFAVAQRSNGVVAFGVGGDEVRGPVTLFGDLFQEVKQAGLRLTPHAGETAGPESVRDALRLGADRIGHGIRAIDDPALVEELRERCIPLEISVTSNARTGVVTSLMEHPLRRLYEAGVPIVINTDDPAIFRTDLLSEYTLLVRDLGFSEVELRELLDNSIQFAFDYK